LSLVRSAASLVLCPSEGSAFRLSYLYHGRAYLHIERIALHYPVPLTQGFHTIVRCAGCHVRPRLSTFFKMIHLGPLGSA
jgi:hypothetical protein